jgi:endonuclease/exonuclease/phosphatase family metal-dependent hydrolase
MFVLNTHFDHEATVARKNSAELVLRTIAQLNQGKDYPVILMGDLNATPSEEPVRTIAQQMQDAFKTSRVPWRGVQGTFNGFEANARLDRRIDYIFVDDLYVVDYLPIMDKTSSGRWLSDHVPVLAEISFFSLE